LEEKKNRNRGLSQKKLKYAFNGGEKQELIDKQSDFHKYDVRKSWVLTIGCISLATALFLFFVCY